MSAKPIEIFVGQTIHQLVESILAANGVEGFEVLYEYPLSIVEPPSIVISSTSPTDRAPYGIGERGVFRQYYMIVRVCAENATREIMVRETLELEFRDMGYFNLYRWDTFPPAGPGEGDVICGAESEVVSVVKQHDPDNPLEQFKYTGYINLLVETGRLVGDEW